MTEEQWLASANPGWLLWEAGLADVSGRRKMRLLLCAIARAAWADLYDGRSRRAVDAVELAVDGPGPPPEVIAEEACQAHQEALVVARITHSAAGRMGDRREAREAEARAEASSVPVIALELAPPALWLAPDRPSPRNVWGMQFVLSRHAGLVREVFGNPFRPVTLDRSALTPLVASLAEAAYEHRELPSGHLELARLAVLSDALEEAGVTGEILDHLRSPGPHVRGCWAVDLLLGRS